MRCSRASASSRAPEPVPGPRTVEERGLRSVLGLTAAIVSAAIPPFLVGALTTRIAHSFAFDTTDVGLAIAGYYLVSGVLSPAGGRVVQRFGPTVVLRSACLLSSVGLVAIAASTSAVQVLVALTLLGLPNAVVQPSCNEVLAGLAPRVRAVSFGIVQASIPTATLAAGALLAVASYGASWRWTVLGVAVLTMAFQAAVPRIPHHRVPRARSATGRAGARAGRRGLLAPLVATGFLASCAVTCLPSFVATTGEHVGVAPWLAALAQGLGSAGSAIVRIVAPAVTGRSSARRQLLTVATLQCAGLLGFLGLATGSAAGFVAGTIAAFTLGWGFNGLFNLIVTNAHPDRIASATGLTQGGVFLGGMVGPLVFAAIAGSTHFGGAWSAMALITCTALTATLIAARRAGRAPAATPTVVEALAAEGARP